MEVHMARKQSNKKSLLKDIFVTPEPHYTETVRLRLKADKIVRNLEKKCGDHSQSRSNSFLWLDTLWFVFINMLRVPIIILLYFVLGWLLLEFFLCTF